MNRTHLTILAACLGFSLHGLAANGQQSAAGGPPKRPYLKNTANPEFKANRLTKPVDLVDLPSYGGKNPQFITGTIFPKVKGGPSVTMQMSVMEKPKAALDWYKDAFSQNGWKPLDNMTGANGLAAMKDNNICQVQTLAPSKRGYACDLLVRYKFYKPTDF